MKLLGSVFLVFCTFVLAGTGQPRPIDRETGATKAPPPAPASFAARYEGGFFGFTDKESGTLKFDDANERLVFFNKEGKELFGIPFGSLLIVSPQYKSVTSAPGTVVSNVPLPGAGIAGGLMKEKRVYLVIQFNDPDVDAKGTTTFKLENKELLDSVIYALGTKAELTQRGDAYYRPRPSIP